MGIRRWLKLTPTSELNAVDNGPVVAPQRSSRPIHLFTLEDRVMFSATPLGDGMMPAESTDVSLDTETNLLTGGEIEGESDPSMELADLEGSDSTELAAPIPSMELTETTLNELDPSTASRHELVIIDAAVGDYERLLDDLLERHDPNVQVDILVLDSDRDGIEQISQALLDFDDLDAIHIVSHGADGRIRLGNEWLSQDTLDAYAADLTGWRDALSDDADLLLYGCRIAGDESGQLLADSISELTGADVAASDDDTGHADAGGDWQLEYTHGSIESELVFSSIVQQQWRHVLAIDTVRDDFSVAAYNNSDGTATWSGDWTDTEDGDPAATHLEIEGGYLSIKHSLSVQGDYLERQFDLSAAANVTVSWDYNNLLGGTAGVTKVQYTFDGDWDSAVTLETYSSANAGSGSASFELPTGHADTRIRFLVDTGSGDTDELRIDNLEVSYTVINQVLIVDTTSDVSDGDTSSIAALYADKGLDGVISLREAIAAANNTTNLGAEDRIHFDIGTGLQTITPTSFLGNITDAVVIDATTQTGYSGIPLIQLDGSSAGAATAGLNILANNVTVRGFIVHSWSDEGIEIDGSTGFGDNNIIQNNWVGIDANGNAAPNADNGILLTSGASGNQIGGTGTYEGNVVSGNSSHGILIRGVGTDNNTVEGNYVGLSTDGTAAVANGGNGISITQGASNNTIGGTANGAGNVISGNAGDGMIINASSNNTVLGNLIGTNAAGMAAIANGDDGIDIENGATNNTIGGITAAARNVISGNTNDGIYFDGATTTGNKIYGNYIGSDITGLAALSGSASTGSGIRAFDAGANEIGGVANGQGNLIAYNADDGVQISGSSAGLQVRGNAIFANAEIGIDLGANEVTANDPDDVDAGPNSLQNYPVLTNATATATETIISGTINSTASTTLIIDFYWTSTAHSGDQEGEYYLGSATLTTDANGNASFRQYFGAVIPAGSYITATATDPASSTSEFSAKIVAAAPTNVLWVSTDTDAGEPGADGLPGGWTQGQLLELSGPDLAHGSNTDGDFSTVIDFDLFTTDATDPNALHYVNRDLTVGSGANTFDLEVGDVLVSFNQNETILAAYWNTGTDTTVNPTDLIVFRPTTAGDYSTGTFYMLLDDVVTTNLRAITLVEQDTVVGGTTLDAGTFLLVQNDAPGEDIYHFTPTGVGAGTTSGSLQTLIDGSNIGIDASVIRGLELIEKETTLGGMPLSEGSILVTLRDDEGAIGNNNLVTVRNDIFALNVASTGIDSTAATAVMVMDGSDVNLDSNPGAENVYGIALFPGNRPPELTMPGGAVNYTENDPATLIDNTATAADIDSNDLDSGELTVEFSSGGTTNDRLVIRDEGTGANQVSLSGSDVRYNFGAGPVTIGTFSGGTSGSDPLVISLNASADLTSVQAVMRNLQYLNVSDDPNTDPRTISVVLTDGDGAASNIVTQTVNMTAENDDPTITSSNTVSVAENNTTVQTVTVSDPDDATFTYSITGGADSGLFSIHPTTGALSFDAAPDYEGPGDNEYVVEVTVDDGNGGTDVQTITVTVTDVDEFDTGAVTDNDGAGNSVAENATVGTAVGVTALATDDDGTDTVSYSLDDNAGGRFAIDGTTGVVTVNGALDAETATSHNITVRATSTDGSFSTQVFNIAVGDVDEFDTGAVTDNDGTGNSVAENATVGTAVGVTALATDDDATDTVSYTLDDNAGGRFAIDGTTGVVTVNGALDAESATSHNITVRATSTDGSFSTQVFNIAVGDVDEFNIGAVTDNDGTGNSVAENATVGTAVGVTALATDDDLTDTVSYTLDDSAGGRFAIDGTTGLVTVNGVLDYETATSHDITVRATSTDGSFSTQVFTINVTDVADAPAGPTSDANALINSVARDADIGTTVGITAMAIDPDVWDTITYSLDDDAGGKLTIDPNTGIVTVKESLTAEPVDSLSIVIRATSSDGSSSTESFDIQLLGFPPGFDNGSTSPSETTNDIEEPSESIVTEDLPEEDDRPSDELRDAAEPIQEQAASVAPNRQDVRTQAASDEVPGQPVTADEAEKVIGARVVADEEPEAKSRSQQDRAGIDSRGFDAWYASDTFSDRGAGLDWGTQFDTGPIRLDWSELWNSVDDQAEEEDSRSGAVEMVAGSAAVVSSVVSVSYVLWSIRGSALAATLASSIPAWSIIDPLPISDLAVDSRVTALHAKAKKETLQDLVRRGSESLDGRSSITPDR